MADTLIAGTTLIEDKRVANAITQKTFNEDNTATGFHTISGATITIIAKGGQAVIINWACSVDFDGSDDVTFKIQEDSADLSDAVAMLSGGGTTSEQDIAAGHYFRTIPSDGTYVYTLEASCSNNLADIDQGLFSVLLI